MPGLIFVPSVSLAVPYATFEFDSPETEKMFHTINEELRCVVCQNQSIAESNAELAQDLRQKVYTMLQEGKSEKEITGFMVQRYGEFILYRPPFEAKTWLLWFGPGIAFILLLVFAVRFMKSQSAKAPVESLSGKDLERVKKLHAQNGEKK
ncbi:cytochrome c-type biogenesis protein CcmH [Cardiobacterium sp. AH-315-I02]|nr:cytochrome c-type biogenesis protein CcmH [Cardiobacterium sp. AH-315-I02]